MGVSDFIGEKVGHACPTQSMTDTVRWRRIHQSNLHSWSSMSLSESVLHASLCQTYVFGMFAFNMVKGSILNSGAFR